MKKKLSLIGLGVVVGSMMLVTSVYAGVGDAPGYEAIKSAVKSTAAVDNVTRHVSVTVQDNGAELLQVNAAIKSDRSEEAGSAQITVQSGGIEQSIAMYHQEGKHIVKTGDSDVYKVIDHAQAPERMKHHDWSREEDPDAVREVEHVADALIGNLKNYVTLDDAAGNSKDIHFKLTGSQIPAAANTIGSLLIQHGAGHHDGAPNPAQALGIDAASLKNSLPELKSDIKIDTVELNATVDADNHITNQAANIEISGKDGQGKEHEVVISMDMSLSDFNGTTPDTVDLTGKQIENVQWNEHKYVQNGSAE